MALDPVTTQEFLKGFFKLMGDLLSQYGSGLFKKNPKKSIQERLLVAGATVDEQKILVAGEYDVEEIRAKREHGLRKLKRELSADEQRAIAEDIDVFLDDVWVEEPEPAQLTFGEGQSRPFEFVEQKRLRNIKQVTREALKALPEYTSVSDEPVDPDWFARHAEAAKDVSNEDMQKVWGRLLAGEIAQPGTFSLRTMEVLRSLSPQEAQLFAGYCNFCTSDGELIAPRDMRQKRGFGLPAKHVNLFIECGLIHADQPFLVGGGFGSPGFTMKFDFGSKSVTVSEPADGKSCMGSIFSLTSVGLAIRRLTEHSLDEAFFVSFCEALESQGLSPQISDQSNRPPTDTESRGA